jgi:hypothetical protein
MGKKPYFRVAREVFYQTTRVKTEKWEKGKGERGWKAHPSHFLVLFKGLCGTFVGFGAGGQELFWKTNPQKRVVFFNQSQVLGLFLDGQARYMGSVSQGCPVILEIRYSRFLVQISISL